jgi:hypothetical protein
VVFSSRGLSVWTPRAHSTLLLSRRSLPPIAHAARPAKPSPVLLAMVVVVVLA